MFYHTAGKPPTGMTNDTLYFVYPVGLGYTWHDPVQPNNDTNLIQLTNAPFLCANGGSPIFPTDQGAGEQTFSFRVWHTHWMSWYTVDQTGAENWTNGAARTVSSLYPAMSAAERLYWKETGTVPPLAEDVTPAGDPAPKNLPLVYNYEPLSRTVITGGSGVGDRPELGVVSEWAAEAFLLQSQKAWQNMRAVALSATSYPESSVLNEASGHIPAVNNGPPGSNHAGAGGAYPTLGAPQPGVYVLNGVFNSGVVNPLLDNPIRGSQYGYITGSWGGGPSSYGNDHYPAFNNMMYTIFGDRHYLDALYLTGNRQISDIQPGPSPVGYRDYILNGVHYYGLFSYCQCERRGNFWSWRDIMLPAALGGDNNPERSYFNDLITENYWFTAELESAIDGPESTSFRSSISPPMSFNYTDTFMDSYGMETSYMSYAMLRDPLGAYFMPKWVRAYNAYCSDTVPGARGIPGEMSSYWCASYSDSAAIHDSSHLAPVGAPFNMGAAFNGADASDWGIFWVYMNFVASSNIVSQGSKIYQLTNGDKIKNIGGQLNGDAGPDELHPDTWYTVTNPDNNAGAFQIVNPATGSPFTSFTQGGKPYSSNSANIIVRPTGYLPSTGWASYGYGLNAQLIITALKDLGFSAINTAFNVMSARGHITPDKNNVRYNWDPTVVVP